jgi:hypothetical protein
MTDKTRVAHPLTADRWPDFERLFGPQGVQMRLTLAVSLHRSAASGNGNG